MRRLLMFVVLLGLLGVLGGLGIWWAVGPVGGKDETVTFVVPQSYENHDLGRELEEKHLVKHAWAFNFLWDYFSGWVAVQPGGYRLKLTMNAWEIKPGF